MYRIKDTGFNLSSTPVFDLVKFSLPQRSHCLGMKTTSPCCGATLLQPQDRHVIFIGATGNDICKLSIFGTVYYQPNGVY
jgi:hypothetical protein